MNVLAPARWAAVNQARDQIEVARIETDEVRQQVAVAAARRTWPSWRRNARWMSRRDRSKAHAPICSTRPAVFKPARGPGSTS